MGEMQVLFFDGTSRRSAVPADVVCGWLIRPAYGVKVVPAKYSGNL